MQTVTDNILVNYEVYGKGSKDILILHGWKRSLGEWRGVAQELSKDSRVFIIDLPGFGASSLPKEAFDTYDYGRFVNDFIAKMNLKKVILVGHSVGGRIAIVSTSLNKRIEKLILVDPSGIDNRSLWVEIKIVINKILKPVKGFVPEFVTNFLLSADYKSAGALLDSYKKIVGQNVSESAKKIDSPTLIVWGDKDKEVPLTTAKTLKSLIKDSTIRIVWNTGHDPFLEKPSKFVEIIEEFLK